jgi:hypothetical protein
MDLVVVERDYPAPAGCVRTACLRMFGSWMRAYAVSLEWRNNTAFTMGPLACSAGLTYPLLARLRLPRAPFDAPAPSLVHH